MLVAKLSLDRVVRLLKPAQSVQFSKRRHVLVCNNLTNIPAKIDPYWVPVTAVVWIMEF